MCVLIVTRKDDVHADMVVNHLASIGASFFRLNTECSTEYLFKIDDKSGYIENTITKLKVDLESIQSIYLRRRSVPDNPLLSETERIFADREWTKFLRNLWVFLKDKKWVNKPNSLEVAKDKYLQLQLAKKVGLKVPHTLMTNSLSEVINFRKDKKIIYKAFDGGSLYPGSSRSIYTTVLSDEIIGKISEDSLRLSPGFFQEYIEKNKELRVTIIGESIFTVEIDSQSSVSTKIDWRKFENKFVPHTVVQLTDEEKSMCLQVMNFLDLDYAALDLIREPDGTLTFLEINSNGQWAWIEVLTGAPISTTIAEYLVR